MKKDKKVYTTLHYTVKTNHPLIARIYLIFKLKKHRKRIVDLTCDWKGEKIVFKRLIIKNKLHFKKVK